MKKTAEKKAFKGEKVLGKQEPECYESTIVDTVID
ncbi:MAG: hypothetical protein QG555_585 [Thermodesulfobacteriota bacterium]|nr:hypothetical protein [Thermodesulfobacteriota bacterium]